MMVEVRGGHGGYYSDNPTVHSLVRLPLRVVPADGLEQEEPRGVLGQYFWNIHVHVNGPGSC